MLDLDLVARLVRVLGNDPDGTELVVVDAGFDSASLEARDVGLGDRPHGRCPLRLDWR